jgi:DegV family protein with EDD domain
MTHYDIALIADSTCDIPQDLVEQYDITIIPQVLIWGDETLRDRVDISPQEFYQRLESDKGAALPSTTQPSPADFQNVYQRALDEGAKEILILTVSSAMSGTFQLAKKVGEQMQAPVHVVDSKGPTMSLGWQVLAAARARQNGADATEMIEAAARVRRKLVQVVCLDTLEYLHRGGRIGNAAWLVGSLLDLKPLVQIDHQAGVVEAAGRARTRQKAIEMLVQRTFEQLGEQPEPDRPLHLAVLHGNALGEAEALAERIRAQYAPRELLINITGPVLGINTGPRALALCGYTETA